MQRSVYIINIIVSAIVNITVNIQDPRQYTDNIYIVNAMSRTRNIDSNIDNNVDRLNGPEDSYESNSCHKVSNIQLQIPSLALSSDSTSLKTQLKFDA